MQGLLYADAAIMIINVLIAVMPGGMQPGWLLV
jgi:hypothetical protein